MLEISRFLDFKFDISIARRRHDEQWELTWTHKKREKNRTEIQWEWDSMCVESSCVFVSPPVSFLSLWLSHALSARCTSTRPYRMWRTNGKLTERQNSLCKALWAGFSRLTLGCRYGGHQSATNPLSTVYTLIYGSRWGDFDKISIPTEYHS